MLKVSEVIALPCWCKLMFCFIVKGKINSDNYAWLCLPFSPMEVFVSQPGSVESLRKANDTPRNNSAYKDMSQYCSACARVKNNNKWNFFCQPWSLHPIFVGATILCVVERWFQTWIWPSISPTNTPCADCAPSPQASLPHLLHFYSNVGNHFKAVWNVTHIPSSCSLPVTQLLIPFIYMMFFKDCWYLLERSTAPITITTTTFLIISEYLGVGGGLGRRCYISKQKQQ